MSGLISKKHKTLITNPLGDSNPVTVQVLGICSALAVTVQMKNALVMSLAVLMVLIGGNFTVSLIRNLIPSRIRIIVQLVVVASLVIIVDQLLKAFVYDVSKQLSVFVGLIITNCIIMGRLEAFALGNQPGISILDGIGNGLGYGWVLVVIAFVKELLGAGKLMGIQIIPQSLYEIGYMNNNLMLLPPSSLIVVAFYIWIQRSKSPQLIEKN